MAEWTIRILESVDEMIAAEETQRTTWQGSETDVIPAHMMLAVIHNGGLAIGAYASKEERPRKLIGFVFGFPGTYQTPDGPRVKHHSHILAVTPQWRGKGLAFALKRAQWQIVRKQGIDRITWTYDPLLSLNAHLNIARLGAVCSSYLRSEYGKMRDGMNAGLPSDRFQVDMWVYSKRVECRLSRKPRPMLTLAQIKETDVLVVNGERAENTIYPPSSPPELSGNVVLVEIPGNFLILKQLDITLGRDWRTFSREFFERAFSQGYLVTDFIHDDMRSYYVLTQGESVLA
jgi:predicted GNAT superfamily acetyltransferase